jgi:trimeric autotransporter adhesin
MSTTYNEELTVLVNCIATTFGDEVGQAINDRITQLIDLQEVDVLALQAQLSALNAALSSNTEGDQLTAQSILTQLAALDSRLDVLEGSTAVAQLQAAVSAIQASAVAEATARETADAANAAALASLQNALDSLTTQVTTIVNEGTGGGAACDCVAITADLAAHATALANLQASDAQQGSQITSLQAAVQTLQGQVAGIAAAQAAADAASATAQTALAQASAAQAAAQAAATAAAAASAAAAAAQATADSAGASGDTLMVEIKNINCANLGASFRQALRARAFAPAV